MKFVQLGWSEPATIQDTWFVHTFTVAEARGKAEAEEKQFEAPDWWAKLS